MSAGQFTNTTTEELHRSFEDALNGAIKAAPGSVLGSAEDVGNTALGIAFPLYGLWHFGNRLGDTVAAAYEFVTGGGFGRLGRFAGRVFSERQTKEDREAIGAIGLGVAVSAITDIGRVASYVPFAGRIRTGPPTPQYIFVTGHGPSPNQIRHVSIMVNGRQTHYTWRHTENGVEGLVQVRDIQSRGTRVQRIRVDSTTGAWDAQNRELARPADIPYRDPDVADNTCRTHCEAVINGGRSDAGFGEYTYTNTSLTEWFESLSRLDD